MSLVCQDKELQHQFRINTKPNVSVEIGMLSNELFQGVFTNTLNNDI
jgi:hypothetical protein